MGWRLPWLGAWPFKISESRVNIHLHQDFVIIAELPCALQLRTVPVPVMHAGTVRHLFGGLRLVD